MITLQQKQVGLAIVNIFETGSVLGRYGAVTVAKGDAGHLTYGRSQTTLASGNLYLLIKSYCEARGTKFGSALRQYLKRLASRDYALDADATFKTLLQDAGGDPVMHEVQDQFFDRVFWDPATRSAESLGIATALGTTVVYDRRV